MPSTFSHPQRKVILLLISKLYSLAINPLYHGGNPMIWKEWLWETRNTIFWHHKLMDHQTNHHNFCSFLSLPIISIFAMAKGNDIDCWWWRHQQSSAFFFCWWSKQQLWSIVKNWLHQSSGIFFYFCINQVVFSFILELKWIRFISQPH